LLAQDGRGGVNRRQLLAQKAGRASQL
jgi:hypothetical protein